MMVEKIDYGLCLSELFPGVTFGYRDASSYNRLVETWDGTDGAIPTEAALIAKWAKAKSRRDWGIDLAAAAKDMPDWLEGHIEHVHNGDAGIGQQTAYDNKKAVRGRKP